MSSLPSKQPDTPLDEELVAYLDGELDAAAAEALELRVQQDEHARSEMQQLDRVWNALDELPRPEVSETFTRTTIEMVAHAAQEELAAATAMLPVRQRKWRLQLAGGVCAGVLLGFALLWLVLPNPNRMLYRNLEVIEQIDPLSEFRDVEFLRQLHAEAGDWLRAEGGEEAQRRATAAMWLDEATPAERARYVEELSDEEKMALVGRTRRYEELSRESRQELASRHRGILTDPSAQELLETMHAYYDWLSDFSEVEQARLRLLDTPQRVAEVVAMQQRRDQREGLRLSPTSALAFREALAKLPRDAEVQQLQRQFAASLIDTARNPQQQQFGRDRFRSPDPWRMLFTVQHLARREGGLPPEAARYFAALETRLVEGIDPSTQEEFRAKEPAERAGQLLRWIGSSRRDQKPDVATLEAYFLSEKFTPEEQYRLLSMPNDQMYKELERQYIDEFLGEERRTQRFGGDWRGRDGFGGPRGQRGGRPGDGRGEGRSERRRSEVPPTPQPPDTSGETSEKEATPGDP